MVVAVAVVILLRAGWLETTFKLHLSTCSKHMTCFLPLLHAGEPEAARFLLGFLRRTKTTKKCICIRVLYMCIYNIQGFIEV